ncbi:Isocitrate dehydrogenase [NAD] catalytic subunit 5 protein [Thalictrum thalictroides]|uniref:Isocitrate dehydrogenase [NAD] catalytic subunit 5 protein n=1 Tax=Thalictrum thalictroides TaxID=46969 RepID=A0A7J6V898_THATH|nr:Isocitrate dehydrogenase [NAD] catalytic subunit 5 protein [Thalictrum thalictroides]
MMLKLRKWDWISLISDVRRKERIWISKEKKKSSPRIFRKCESVLSHNPIQVVTLFHGHGIGPEIAQSVKQVFKAAEVPIEWEEHFVADKVDPRTKSFLTWECLESIRRNGVCLKGPMCTPTEHRYGSLETTLGKELGLYANVETYNSLYGYRTHKGFGDFNVVKIKEVSQAKENFEEDFTTQKSKRVAEYAFQYAKAHCWNKVSAVSHVIFEKNRDVKFLESCREVAEMYPEIEYEELVRLECHKKNGLIYIKYCLSFTIGEGGVALAEVLHGSAPFMAGKLHDNADQIHNAVMTTITEGKYRTADLGGTSTTTDFTEAICNQLEASPGQISTINDFRNAVQNNLNLYLLERQRLFSHPYALPLFLSAMLM